MQIVIDSLGVADVGSQQDYVVRVTWRLVADTQVLMENGVPVQIAEPRKTLLSIEQTSAAFIPFNSLTHADVAGWIMATDEYSDAVSILTSRLMEANAPSTKLKPLPWMAN